MKQQLDDRDDGDTWTELARVAWAESSSLALTLYKRVNRSYGVVKMREWQGEGVRFSDTCEGGDSIAGMRFPQSSPRQSECPDICTAVEALFTQLGSAAHDASEVIR